MKLIPGAIRWLAAGLIFFVLAVPASAAPFPDGKYTAAISGHQWQLEFNSGKYSVSRDGEKGVEGTYRIAGNLITLLDTGGRVAQKGSAGIYKWKFADGRLSFRKVKDGGERAKVLTATPFTQDP